MLSQKYLENGIIDLDILDQQSTQPVKQATPDEHLPVTV